MRKIWDKEDWERAKEHDIRVGSATIKGHPKGGWVLPGGTYTENEKRARKVALRIDNILST